MMAALVGPALAGAVTVLLTPTPWGPLVFGGEDASRTSSVCVPRPTAGDLHDGQVVIDPGPGRVIRIDGVRLLSARDLRLVEAALVPEKVMPDGSLQIPGTGPGWPPSEPGLEPATGAHVGSPENAGSGAGRRALVLRLRPTGSEPRYSGVRVDYTWEGRARYAVTSIELELKETCS